MKVLLVPAVQKLTEILFGGLSLNEVSHWLMNASVWVLLGIGAPLVLFVLGPIVGYIPPNRSRKVRSVTSMPATVSRARPVRHSVASFTATTCRMRSRS